MPLSHAILACLDWQPMSGYDLKKFFDQSVGHFWSATQSHIYKALVGLEEAGWVEMQVIPQEGKPNRKEYHITGNGRTELRRWLVTPLPLQPVREAWLIQIFFAHHSANDEILALIAARRAEIETQQQIYHREAQAAINAAVARQTGLPRSHQLWQMTLDYGLAYYAAELAWLTEMEARVRQLPPL